MPPLLPEGGSGLEDRFHESCTAVAGSATGGGRETHRAVLVHGDRPINDWTPGVRGRDGKRGGAPRHRRSGSNSGRGPAARRMDPGARLGSTVLRGGAGPDPPGPRPSGPRPSRGPDRILRPRRLGQLKGARPGSRHPRDRPAPRRGDREGQRGGANRGSEPSNPAKPPTSASSTAPSPRSIPTPSEP